ncbi:MAG TPA: hypothetical protein VMH33_07725 [Solirubrobacterales bacterium]|nr:hypothetical protein [Solirubrobacterales bacterium]
MTVKERLQQVVFVRPDGMVVRQGARSSTVPAAGSKVTVTLKP